MVDVADFLQFVNAFGLEAGQNGYDAKFDLDDNGIVNVADFLLFIAVFGQTVPEPVEPPPADSVEGDKSALINLYNATDGDNWTSKTNWLSDKPLGEWYGVTTNEEGRVDSLLLQKNQLSGSIPESIGNLTNLTILYLFTNQLSGSIPDSIGNLSNLVALGLLNNNLSGSIPASLGDLSELEWLGLSENQLSGPIPESFGKLSKLSVLILDENQLSGSIPESIGKLTNLGLLDLHNNQLSGPIPESLGKLTKLYLLLLSGNTDLCMPASLKNWRHYSKAPPCQ